MVLAGHREGFTLANLLFAGGFDSRRARAWLRSGSSVVRVGLPSCVTGGKVWPGGATKVGFASSAEVVSGGLGVWPNLFSIVFLIALCLYVLFIIP